MELGEQSVSCRDNGSQLEAGAVGDDLEQREASLHVWWSLGCCLWQTQQSFPQPHAAMVTVCFDVITSPKQHTYFWGCMCFEKSRTEHPKPLFLLCGWVDLGVGMGVVLTAT